MVEAVRSRQAARFIGLDGLRGIAALFVLGEHVPDPTLRRILPDMGLAVDLFFILSGFVLAHAYQERLTSGMSLTSFIRIRLVRLYPLYILGTILMFCLLVVRGVDTSSVSKTALGASVLAGLAMAPVPAHLSITPPLLFPFDPPAWSLFFELVVNIAFAVAAPRRGWIAAMLGMGVILSAATVVHFGTIETGWDSTNFLGGFGRTTLPFFTGVVLYRFWKSGALDKWKLPVWVPAAALVLLFASPFTGWLHATFYLVASTLILPLIVCAGANARASGTVAQVCVVLGTASYAFYILQVPVISICEALTGAGRFDLALLGVWGSILLGCLVLAVALIADAIYDIPARRWLAGMVSKPRKA